MRSTPRRVKIGLLNDDLVVGALEHPSADRRVLAFVVLAHDPEVDVAGLAAGERRADPGHQPHRPQVDVLLELPADRDQQAPERDVIGHVRKADRAEKDRVVVADLREPVVRHHRAGGTIAFAAPRKVLPRNCNPKRFAAASTTRIPSGTTSLPIPSPGMTAILNDCMQAWTYTGVAPSSFFARQRVTS